MNVIQSCPEASPSLKPDEIPKAKCVGWEKGTDFVCSKQSRVHPSLFPVSLMLHHKSEATQMCSFYLRSSPPCSLQYRRGSKRTVPTNLCEDALSHARPIYTIKATWWDPWGNEQREGQRREGKNIKALQRGGMRAGIQAPKNNEAKSEDKRGAISVAGFMYCQHYPCY